MGKQGRFPSGETEKLKKKDLQVLTFGDSLESACVLLIHIELLISILFLKYEHMGENYQAFEPLVKYKEAKINKQ